MINLLPSEHKAHLGYARKNTILFGYVSVVLIVAIAFSIALLSARFYADWKLTKANDRLAELDGKLEDVEEIRKDADTVISKLSILREIFQKETDYVSLLTDIESAVLPGATLVRLKLDGKESSPLEIEFLVPNESVAADLRQSLENSERFKFVDIQQIDNTGTRARVVYKLSYEPGQAK